MKQIKIFGLAALAAMALTAFAAGSASATTFEVGGAAQNKAVSITASLESGTSLRLGNTSGAFANTCTSSHLAGTSTVFTGAVVSGPLSSLAHTNCSSEVVTDKAGSLSISWISGTTNGTVISSGLELTSTTPLGKLTCKTGEGTDMGTATGKASGQATLDLKAVINCGFLNPSSVLEGSYVVTSPEGLGVVS